jgi:hypothetical protein
VNPLDLALPPQTVGQAVEAVANDTVDPLDACQVQRLGKQVGDDGLGHEQLRQ